MYVTARGQYVAISDTTTRQNIGSQMGCYIDTTATLQLNDVLTKTFIPFDSVQFPPFLITAYQYNFWFSTTLKNTSTTPKKILFSVGEMYKQRIAIFRTNGLTITTLSPDKRIAPKAYSFDHKYLPIEIAPNESIRLVVQANDLTGQRFLLDPHIITPNTEYQNRLQHLYNERIAFFINILLNSILLFVFIFVVTQYFIVRQRYLAYYALYVFCMLCFHLYGFSYSSYIQTPFSFIPFLKFNLRQNFYVIITQIGYMLFLKEFFRIEQVGTTFQKKFFKTVHYVFLCLLGVELFFSLVYVRLDMEAYNIIFTQFLIILISLYLLYMMFFSSNLNVLLSIKLASLTLFVGVIVGFLSATFEWVKITSPMLIYYPNYFFNFCVMTEIFLYSLAIAQLYFRNISEKSELTQRIALSELNTLRSQMNPHFLFNSLNSIKNLIIKNKNQEAAIFLTELSALLREILHKSREQFLSLEEELRFTEDYLKIEKKRFSGAFDYELIVEHPEWLLPKTVPAFLLQPFVENCIKHGFKGLNEVGKVRICIFPIQEAIQIEISDNGIGRQNAAKLKLTDRKHESIGTKLIEDRLKIINDVYGWQIFYQLTDLQNPSGTKVSITIPYFE